MRLGTRLHDQRLSMQFAPSLLNLTIRPAGLPNPALCCRISQIWLHRRPASRSERQSRPSRQPPPRNRRISSSELDYAMCMLRCSAGQVRGFGYCWGHHLPADCRKPNTMLCISECQCPKVCTGKLLTRKPSPGRLRACYAKYAIHLIVSRLLYSVQQLTVND